ncbi:MAG: HAD family hydrolase, partial [Chloroflexia bacterium]|nr:HAD family hydrolase [Chloroflexia bacterium]
PLMLVAVFLMVLAWLDFAQQAYDELIQKRTIGVRFLGAFAIASWLLVGQILLLAVFGVVFSLTNKAVARTRDTSRKRLTNILGEMPRFVWLVHNGVEVQIPFDSLQVGDCIIVHPGELIPIDGVIVVGSASIDQHMLTGEAQPAEKHTGDLVYAGTILLAGTLHIQVEKTGSDTVAAQIGKVLDRTADYRSSTELQGLLIADYSVPLTFGVWFVTLVVLGPVSATAAITCSIGYQTRLTAPLSVLNFLAMAADHGLLVKDGRALELVYSVDTVVFDKTGTLTQEQPHVGAIHTTNGYSDDAILSFAAAAEYKQTHPIARAILHAAATRQLAIPPISDAAYTLGYGLTVQLDESVVRVGSARFLQQEGITIPVQIETVQQQCYAQGQSLVYVAVDDHLAGAIELHPTIRPEARAMIQRLKQRGLDLYIISGDHAEPTQRLAHELGIDHFFA